MKIFYKPALLFADIIVQKGRDTMKKEVRTVVYDDDLHMEAYRFEGLAQPFPNHFHEYYVIGFVEKGERALSCAGLGRGSHRQAGIARIFPKCNF